MMKSPGILKGLLEVVMGLIYFPVYIESGRVPESGQKTLGNLSKRSKKYVSDQKMRDLIDFRSWWIWTKRPESVVECVTSRSLLVCEQLALLESEYLLEWASQITYFAQSP
jgi:hypothetical protein